MASSETKHCQGTLKELFSDHALLKNLFVVSIIWAFTSFTYYLIIFKLKSLPGDIFINSTFTSLANAVGHFTCLGVYKIWSAKKVMLIFFIIQLLGSIPLCMQFDKDEFYTGTIMPISLLFCTYGAAG